MIEYITYKGKKIPIRISYYVLTMYMQETGQSVFETDNNSRAWEIIIKYAVQAGYRAVEKPVPDEFALTEDDSDKWIWMLDECYPEFIKLAQKFFLALIPQILPELEKMRGTNKEV